MDGVWHMEDAQCVVSGVSASEQLQKGSRGDCCGKDRLARLDLGAWSPQSRGCVGTELSGMFLELRDAPEQRPSQ